MDDNKINYMRNDRTYLNLISTPSICFGKFLATIAFRAVSMSSSI
jgi:hypothetical protein